MSIEKRRNSLLKSSLSIRSIGESVNKFREGLTSARISADNTVKKLRQSNIFKRNLIRDDNKYFQQRQENVRRKEREDELEASSVQGVPKTQGTILAKSTRGFLGRILDFLGILLIGWAITNLPKIISGIQGLIKRISSITGILGLFVDGIKGVVLGIGQIAGDALKNILRLDFLGQKKEIEKTTEDAQAGLQKSSQELIQSANDFASDENAKRIGLEPPTFNQPTPEERENGINSQQQIQNDAAVESMFQQEDEIDKEIKSLQVTDSRDETTEGTADDIEGVEQELEAGLKTDPPLKGSGGGTPESASQGSETVVDPRDELKKKQAELISGQNNRKTRRRRRNTKSTFLGTPDSVKNINQSVASNSQSEYRGEVVASIEITDEMKSQVLNPVKKELADKVTGKRKSKTKIYLVEKAVAVNTSQSEGMPMSGGTSPSINKKVNEEKMLMDMQSTSTLKYT
tara:strand:+ start:3478 stop:4857 length:1380 start_codon:yes stop_codon:yes gene_type:complete